MSSPASSLRQRGAKGEKKRAVTPLAEDSKVNGQFEQAKQEAKSAITSEWDYKLALAVITILAFVTRFWGITFPAEVVFDEVHFGKVSSKMNVSWT